MTDESFARLLVVQDLDTLISQLAHRREMLAERSGLTALETELRVLAGQEAVLSAQRAALTSTQKELEAQIATINERSSAIETRMYAARGSSTRDLQAMDEEVRHLNQRRSELEDEELVAMVDQEPVDAALAALAARATPVEQKVTALRGEVAAGDVGDRCGVGDGDGGPGRGSGAAPRRAGRSLRGLANASEGHRRGAAHRSSL